MYRILKEKHRGGGGGEVPKPEDHGAEQSELETSWTANMGVIAS